jgi:hypothetical protein
MKLDKLYSLSTSFKVIGLIGRTESDCSEVTG